MPRINQDLSGVNEDDMNRDGGGWKVKPDGWYRACFMTSTYKQNSKGTGMNLGFEGQFLDAPHRGDKLFENLAVDNPSAKAEEISRARLKELAIAAGHPTPDYVEDSDDLHAKPFMVRVYSEEAYDEKYGDADGLQQRIGEYLSVSAWQA